MNISNKVYQSSAVKSYLKKIDKHRERKPPSEWTEIGKETRMYDLLDDAPDDIKGLFQYDNYSLWSFTHLAIGNEICNELLTLPGITRNSTVTDAMAGIGGNAIAFARVFKQVTAIELDPTRKIMLDHNIELFDFNNISTNTGQYQSMMNFIRQDVIFIDPPWGIDYRDNGYVRIIIDGDVLLSLEDLINSLPVHKYCVVKLPFNYDIDFFYKHVCRTIIKKLSYPRPNTCEVLIIEGN